MGLSENSLFPVEHALEMMIFFDGFGKITYGNAAAMKKLEYGEDLCGKYIYDIFPNEFFRDRATFQTKEQDLFSGGSKDFEGSFGYRRISLHGE